MSEKESPPFRAEDNVSKYLVFSDIVFADRELLLSALAQLGYSQVEVGERLPLFGYRGDRRPETAELAIRREHLHPLSNDVGFARTPRGYVPIISEFDQRVLRGGNFLRDLRVAYAEATALAIARARRGTLHRQVEGGTIRIVVRY